MMKFKMVLEYSMMNCRHTAPSTYILYPVSIIQKPVLSSYRYAIPPLWIEDRKIMHRYECCPPWCLTNTTPFLYATANRRNAMPWCSWTSQTSGELYKWKLCFSSWLFISGLTSSCRPNRSLVCCWHELYLFAFLLFCFMIFVPLPLWNECEATPYQLPVDSFGDSFSPLVVFSRHAFVSMACLKIQLPKHHPAL